MAANEHERNRPDKARAECFKNEKYATIADNSYIVAYAGC